MAKHVRTADLTRQVDIEQRTDTVNGLGEGVPTWTVAHSGVWAQMQPVRGREFFAAGQMQTPADVRWRIRWRAGVTANMRIIASGLPYEIVGEPIDVDGARQTLELMCTTGIRDGR
jgi:SPP1 family predicted phage head-tail adaptor